MVKKAFAWFLLVGLFLTSGCVTGKSIESAPVPNSPSSTTNSTAFANDAVTDPYGNSIVRFGDTTNFPLYAALKYENIYLYGIKPYGMVLYQGGMGTYFDWPGLAPRAILPKLSYLDYDNDGEKELAVALYVCSGTQLSIMDLHILEIVKPAEGDPSKPKYIDYPLLGDDVDKWMTKKFVGTLSDDENTINLNFDGNTYQTKNWTDHPAAGKFKRADFGDIVEFNFDDNGIIHVKIAVGAAYENVGQPHLFGDINGEVRFIGNGFILENCTLSLYQT